MDSAGKDLFVHKRSYGSYFPLHDCVFSLQSILHCQTIAEILHHFTVTLNNIEVIVNTCTCKDVFTIITTKDQSGGIYNNYSTGGQRFMAVVNKSRPRATPSDLVCLLP